MSWHGLWITNLPVPKRVPEIFLFDLWGPKINLTVEKSTRHGQGLLREVQVVSKTCSGVGFGQQTYEHWGSKSGQWLNLGEISP